MDFDAQLANALGDEKNAPPPPPKKEEKKEKRSRKRDKEVSEPKPKRKKIEEVSEEESAECAELYGQIVRFAEAFPDCAGQIPIDLSEKSSKNELEFHLAKIQRRINAKNELDVVRSGLVSTCMVAEMGSTFIPGEPVKLKGFAMSVQANIQAFDTCLKQILCKYGDKFALSAEATLGLLLLKHGATTHMANLAQEAKKPKIDVDIKEEPTDQPPDVIIQQPLQPPPEVVDITQTDPMSAPEQSLQTLPE